MFGFGRSKNRKQFEKIVKGLTQEEIGPVSITVFNNWKMFSGKYKSVEQWLDSEKNMNEWFSYLTALAHTQFQQEQEGKVPFGATAGVLLLRLYFESVVSNDSDKNLDAMSELMERLNKIGFKLNQQHNTVA